MLRIRDAAGTRDVSVTKADYTLTPVSSRYGARIINDGGRQVGYVNLRTFIDTADPALRNAFAQFRAAGITDIIVDFRYNGGGLVSIAELMGDLLGAQPLDLATCSRFTTFRPEKSSNNSDPPVPAAAAVGRADPDRLHRHRRHGLGERARDQRLHSLSAQPTRR